MKYAITKHFDWLTPFTEATTDAERKEILCLKYPETCRLLETNAEYFSQMAQDVERLKVYKLIGFKTFREFCVKKLGHTLDEVATIVGGVKKLQARGRTGPIPVKEAMESALEMPGQGYRTDRQLLYNIQKLPTGTGSERQAARIHRDHPDIEERVKAGEFRSMHAAAIAAGIAKPKIACAKEVEAIVRLIHRHFSEAEVQQIKEGL